MRNSMYLELCEVLRKYTHCIIEMKPGCAVKHNFNGKVRVRNEDIKRVKNAEGTTILYDTDWFAPDGVKMAFEDLYINMFCGRTITLSLRHPNGTVRKFELVEEIRDKAFNGGRFTEKRLDIIQDVCEQWKEWLVDGHTILTFDALIAEIRKRAGVKG